MLRPRHAGEDFTAETMSDAEIEAAVQEFLPAALLPQLQSSAFKERVDLAWAEHRKTSREATQTYKHGTGRVSYAGP